MQLGTTPARSVINRYERDLRDLGATSVEPAGPARVNVTFAEPWDTRFASETLRGTIDGVEMIYKGRDGDALPDILSSPVEQAMFAARLTSVTSLQFDDDTMPRAVTFGVADETDRARIAGLVVDEFGDTGTKVSIVADQGRAAGL